MIIARDMSVFDGPGQVSKLSEELQSLLPLHPTFEMIDVRANRAVPPSKFLDLICVEFQLSRDINATQDELQQPGFVRYGAAPAKYFHCMSVEGPSESDKHHRTRCATPAGCQKQNYGHVSCIHVRSMRQQRGLEFCYLKVQTAGM